MFCVSFDAVMDACKIYKARILTLILFFILIASSFNVQPNVNSWQTNINAITNKQTESMHLETEQAKSEDKMEMNFELVNKTNTSSKCPVGHDLPISKSPFVGRHHDISEIIKKMSRAHLISISGAPGFGKSTLAIHVGHKMLERGTSVRYIDVADAFSYTKSKSEEKRKKSTNKKNVTSEFTSVTSQVGGVPAVTWPENTRVVEDITADKILAWSRTVECHTVLILDNCDDQIDSDKGRQMFIEFLKKIITYSQSNISILLTSRQQLLIIDDFDSWRVKELSLNSSMELLRELAPGINAEDSNKIINVVEGCPLALKVVGKILNRYDDKLLPRLEEELKIYPMNVLDQASTPKERFRVIMDVAFDRLLPSEQECGFYISLFPGSFDYNAASAILPFNNSGNILTNYTEQSLLEEFIFEYNSRYKMHKLIKEYFRDRGGKHLRKKHFKVHFCEYFSQYLVKYATYLGNVTEFEQYQFKVEHQNIHYLLDILLERVDSNYSLTEVQALAFAATTDLLTKTDIQNKYSIMIKHISPVCEILDDDKCGYLYSQIIEHLHKLCGCQTVLEFVGQLIHDEYPCEEIFTCKTMVEIGYHDSVCFALSGSEQIFLVRLHHFRCTILFIPLALLVNVNLILPLIPIFYNLLICPLPILAPKHAVRLYFWLGFSFTILPLICVIICTCLLCYFIISDVVTFLCTAFPFLVTSFLSIIAYTVDTMCWPLPNKIRILNVLLFILAIYVWISSPVC